MLFASTPETYMTIIWVVIILATIFIELATPNLTSIWFCCGAIVALIINLVGLPLWLQLLLFVVVSGVLLFSVGKIARKYFLKNKQTKTNIDAAIGQFVIVTKSVSIKKAGEVKYSGLIWTAITNQDKVLHPGDKVKIVAVEGNKFIVE